MKSVIYAIDRQYGSGGHEIGEKLAKELNIPFYDNQLIALAAEKAGISKDVFEEVDERPTNSFLYSLAMGSFGFGGSGAVTDLPINDKLFIASSEVIREIADKGPCVFVGRCADYILRDYPNCVKFFCYGDINKRISRIKTVLDLPKQKAIEVINRKDKTTASYYNYYTNKKWGAKGEYDLLINTSKLSVDSCVKLIKNYVELL